MKGRRPPFFYTLIINEVILNLYIWFSDIRYFIYSSELSHELCYATSKYPDKDFVYRGTIISNGDIGLEGREAKDRLAATGNNHGSIECINGEWYIFYHRQTHKTSYSRQGCAEKITILPDGSIPQVEMTSCGLNRGPLVAQGEYPAVIACNLTKGAMPHIEPATGDCDIPYITHEGEERFITDIKNGTLIGYKYFNFTGKVRLEVCAQGEASGEFEISTGDDLVGKITITPSNKWTNFGTDLKIDGVKPLYLNYVGDGKVKLLSFNLN